MKRLAPFLILATLLATPARAENLRDEISAIIAQRHPVDTPETWRSLGSQAPATIIAMYQETTSTFRRIRLLQALGWFDSPDAKAFIENQITDGPEPLIRQAAVRTVPFSEGAAGADLIDKSTRDADPQMRIAAGEALQRLAVSDAHAKALYDDYLKNEKVSWISDRLKKTPPPTPMPLVVTGSSEELPDPKLAGRWKGYWLTPKSATTPGLLSQAAVVTIELPGGTAVNGELSLAPPTKSKPQGASPKMVFQVAKARGARVYGQLAAPPRSWAFEGQISHEAGHWLLTVHVPELGATLVVRHDP